jgi:hypothetical protein
MGGPPSSRTLFQVMAAALVATLGLAFAAKVTYCAGAISPQAIIAALRRDPTSVPMAPDFFEYLKGSEQPVSQYDREHGVIAYFTIAVNYKDAAVSNGIAYRIFSDSAAAEKYWGDMSAMNNSKIMSSLGSDINVDIDYDVKSDAPWRGRQPFRDETCETYISARAENLATARCYAQHLDLPVIVSGIRIASVSGNGTGKYQLSDAERQKLMGFATLLLDAGMSRVERIETDGR